MFFHELEVLVREHPDLCMVAEQVDRRLSEVCLSSPLRPGDFSCTLGADENQVVSVFEWLAKMGVLVADDMVECERCQNLMFSHAFRQALQDEDPFECTGCGRILPRRSKHLVIFRLTAEALGRTKPAAKSPNPPAQLPSADKTTDEPLSERAQYALLAMLELDAIDSDRRKSTEEIASAAVKGKDANALKSVMAELKTRKLIDSKSGRGGGCWLTERGQSRAQKLRNH